MCVSRYKFYIGVYFFVLQHMVILSACNNVEKAPLLDKSINIIQPPSSVEKAKNCGGDAAAISRQTDKRFAAEKRSVSPDATRPADNTVRNSNPLLNNSERTAKPTVLMQQPSTSTSGNFVASVPSPFSNLSSGIFYFKNISRCQTNLRDNKK